MAALPSWFAIFMFLGCSKLLAAVRLGDDLPLLDDPASADECKSSLSSVFQRFTYRRLFSPIFDGTYRIRNRQSGKFLTGTRQGYLGTSLHHVGSGPSDWRLRRVKRAGRPTYTLQNKDSKRFLVAGEGQLFAFREISEAAYWNLNLDDEGVFWSITSAANSDEAVTENVSGAVALLNSAKSGEKSQWFLDLRLSVLRMPKNDMSAYKSQYSTAFDIPMWEGTELTWIELFNRDHIDIATAYAQLRKGAKTLGKISETHRRIVTENKVHLCDVSVEMMMGLVSRHAKVVENLRNAAGQPCEGQSLTNVSHWFKMAVEEQCFASCIDETSSLFEAKKLACEKPPDNVTALLIDVFKLPGCKGLPSYDIEYVAEFAQSARCQKWPRPFFLWVGDTDGPGKLSLATADGNPACSVKEGSRSSKDIQRSTTQACPSGSTCQCPRTYKRGRQTIDELKWQNSLYFKNGEGSLAALVSAGSNWHFQTVAWNIMAGGKVAASIAAVPHPVFLAAAGWNLASIGYAAFKFQCADTVACWPKYPRKTKAGCRVLPEAKTGGSPVWFLPPPGVMVKRRRWFRSLTGRCEYTACDPWDMMQQRVGFGAPEGKSGRQNVYNCQYLDWDDMTPKQQKQYVDELKKTNQGEYGDEPVFH